MTRRIICFLIEWRLRQLHRWPMRGPMRRALHRIIRQIYFPRKP